MADSSPDGVRDGRALGRFDARKRKGKDVDLQESQYQNGLKYAKSADEALQRVIACLKRHDEPSRIRRVIEEAEGMLKKVKRELRVG